MLSVAVVARIPVVDHRRRDIDGYAPESVDYVLETGEIDEHVVRDVEPVGVAQSLLEGVGSARARGTSPGSDPSIPTVR